MNYPVNQLEFERLFSDEMQCLAYLKFIRWPSGFVCPHCDGKPHWETSGGLFKCQSCSKRCSVTAGTFFHKSKLPLTLWFRAFWWVVAQKNGVSAQGLQRILGLGSYRTAWTWLHKIRRLMVLPNRDRLNGDVEVDETFVGESKSGKRGRGAEGKVPVVIALELRGKGTGRVRLERVPNCTRVTLEAFIEAKIEKGSKVITDGWKAYGHIEDKGYGHEVQQAIQMDGEEILPELHRIAALLKRWLLGTHQSYCVTRYMAYYLDEFCFRYNRRRSNSRGLLFKILLEQAMAKTATNYKEITGSKSTKHNR